MRVLIINACFGRGGRHHRHKVAPLREQRGNLARGLVCKVFTGVGIDQARRKIASSQFNRAFNRIEIHIVCLADDQALQFFGRKMLRVLWKSGKNLHFQAFLFREPHRIARLWQLRYGKHDAEGIRTAIGVVPNFQRIPAWNDLAIELHRPARLAGFWAGCRDSFRRSVNPFACAIAVQSIALPYSSAAIRYKLPPAMVSVLPRMNTASKLWRSRPIAARRRKSAVSRASASICSISRNPRSPTLLATASARFVWCIRMSVRSRISSTGWRMRAIALWVALAIRVVVRMALSSVSSKALSGASSMFSASVRAVDESSSSASLIDLVAPTFSVAEVSSSTSQTMR